jgi:RNA polymerase sigma-70 factor, ECF subfamily
MVETAEEQKLVRASQDGDAIAFEGLVRHYQKMVHSLTFRMSGSWADAQDLAQDTFIQAYKQIGTFRGDAQFSSWLYRIAMNQCLNARKRTQRQATLGQEWKERATAVGEDAEVSQRVHEALQQLNPKQRAAVVLTTYEGHKHGAAAKIMGCSETTVSWYLFTARSKLKTLLRDLQRRSDE